MTRRFGEPPQQADENESISRGEMDAIDQNSPPEEKDIECTLVISNENRGLSVQMFFTLHLEFDIQQFSCKGSK